MNVAVLADIHGNLPALEAVLKEPEIEDAEQIVLLGDIALGPMPGQTLDRLASFGDRAIWVHGNCERELLDAFSEALDDGPHAGAARGAAAMMSRWHRELINDLPMSVSLPFGDLGTALFCHATPRRDDEFVLVDSPVSVWEDALAGFAADLFVLGHTHMQFDRLVAGRRVVNAGSVGMPYGSEGACWALITDRDVRLRQTRYDVDDARRQIEDSGFPSAAQWARDYVVHPPSDVEALAAFSELVARDS